MPLLRQDGQPARPAGGSPLRVLIVDDHLVVRGAVRSALEKLDRPFLVIEADSGEEALSIIRNSKIDIIFCDIQLPGISGPEALAHVYGAEFPRPFMVLMTAHKSDFFLEIGRKVGVYEFLAKPFRTEALARVLSEARGARPLGAA